MKRAKERYKEPHTIMCVDYSKDGKLAAGMKELTKRLAEVTGFNIKVLEIA